MPKIHLTAPDGNTFEFEITETVRFGRAEGNDIIIPDGSVSSNHGEMTPHGDSIEITDKGSTNGTFINGERVEHGTVHVGGSFKLGSVEGILIADAAAEEEAPEEEATAEEEVEATEEAWSPTSGGGAPMTGYGATPCPAQLRTGFGPKKKVKDSSGNLIMTTAVLSLIACAAAAFMILKMAP